MAERWMKRAERAWHERTLTLARSAGMHGGPNAAKRIWYERRLNKKDWLKSWIKREKKKANKMKRVKKIKVKSGKWVREY